MCLKKSTQQYLDEKHFFFDQNNLSYRTTKQGLYKTKQISQLFCHCYAKPLELFEAFICKRMPIKSYWDSNDTNRINVIWNINTWRSDTGSGVIADMDCEMIRELTRKTTCLNILLSLIANDYNLLTLIIARI